ncbi:alpha/beta hydrolase [Brachybacterium hainanense]|uniref:Alpha/beta hydrolase n=1 Tax=Brachybacterium hainanense TaxID=1541174 RepID=A0ABV6RAJ0_9MICO
MVAAVVLTASGCSLIGQLGQGGQGPGSSTSAASDGGAPGATPALAEVGTSAAKDLPADPAADPAYEAYYAQRVQWGECGDDVDVSTPAMQCGTVRVPRVWNDPAVGDLELAVMRLPASGEAQGSLLTNPGGPGGSGIDFVAGSAQYVFSQEVLAAYDIIGFDPRGVARSEGIRCLDDAQTDEYLAATGEIGTPEGLQAAKDEFAAMAAACEEHSGDLLPYVDTYSAARDLDVLRSAVGSEKLDYLGYSYGTYLGASYAELYPERVGRFVLDGALDPTLTSDAITRGQAEGFENATTAFVEGCLSRGSDVCPLKGTTQEGKQQLRAFFDSVDAQPLTTDDDARPLTGALARSGLLLTLYNDENWSMGYQALSAAMNGDGSALLFLADLGSDRNDDGTYNGNGTFAITAVNCLDHVGVADEQWQVQESAALAEEFPTWGDGFGFSQTMCDLWPAGPVRAPAPIAAAGSDLIVVIGTTGDPATPYAWAQGLDSQLENSTLITYEGEGHTAYGRSGGCVEEAVDAYLLEGTAPEDGLTCS